MSKRRIRKRRHRADFKECIAAGLDPEQAAEFVAGKQNPGRRLRYVPPLREDQ